MRKLFYAISVFMIVLSGCKNEKKSGPINTVDQSKLLRVSTLKFNDKDYFDECLLVALETTEASLISEISQIEMIDNQIYILDRKLSQILVFDLKGKYIGNVGVKGGGPEEYLAISSFYVDTKKKTINLFDPLNMAVNQYELSGKFIRKIAHKNSNLSFLKKSIPVGKDELFCYFGSNWEDNSIYSIISASDYSTIQNIRYYPGESVRNISHMYSNQPFSLYDGGVRFGMLFSDTISIYKNSRVDPYLVINDKKNIPQELLNKRLEEGKNDYSLILRELTAEDKYTTGLLNVFENDRYIFCDFKVKLFSMNAILWDKKKKEGLYLENYLHGGIDFGMMKYCNNDFIVRVWDGARIEYYKEQLAEDASLKDAYPKSIINTIIGYNEEDNPMLIFYKLKN